MATKPLPWGPQAARAAVAPPVEPQAAAPKFRRDFFIYTLAFLALAPNTSTETAFQIQADSDFELEKLSFWCDDATGQSQMQSTRLLPDVTIQITDTGTGRQMFNAPVAVPSIFGSGEFPFIMQTTKIFSANASVAVAVSNFNPNDTYNLRLNFIGSKIFRYG